MMDAERNRNRDIELLTACKPTLLEVSLLREKDAEERRAYIGSQRMDGMPRGNGRDGGMEEAIIRQEALHSQRISQMKAYEEKVAVAEMILRKVDIDIRPIIRMLYVDQMPVWRVAQIAHMSESTVKRIKSAAEKKDRF